MTDSARNGGSPGNTAVQRGHDGWTVQTVLQRTFAIAISEPLLLPENPSLINAGEDRTRRLVAVDDGLPPRTIDLIRRYFAAYDVPAVVLTIPGGERCKSLETTRLLLEAFFQFGLNRRTQPIIVFGGGAVLDVTGFAASIYRRGVPFIRVPTTLVAYIDAAVGVKTGISLGAGKNLVGSFVTPHAVFLDRSFLATQDVADIVSGLGEILKLAVGCDIRLMADLETYGAPMCSRDFFAPGVHEVLTRCVDIMLANLAPNIFEDELTRAVDLGHTFSQPLELGRRGPPMRHGEAVAVDVNLSALLAAGRGLVSDGDARAVIHLTRRLGLPLSLRSLSPADLWESLMERTLHRGGKQRVPLPGPLGHCTFVNDLTLAELESASRALVAFRSQHCLSETP